MDLSDNVPCVTFATRTAESEALSTSASLPSTPGTAIVQAAFSERWLLLFWATGASLTGVMVIVTAAVFEATVPSLAA